MCVCVCVIMATNFLELATTLKYLGAKWLPGEKVNFTPCILASVEDLYAFVPLPPQLSVPFLLFPALLLQWQLGASVPQVSVHGKRAPTVEVEQ